MKGYPSLTPEQKREIIGRIKEKGERVADLAKEYGVQPRIIYYNHQRIHTALKYPPAIFAQRIAFSENLTKNGTPGCPRKAVSDPRRCLPLLPAKTLTNFSKAGLNNNPLIKQGMAETQSV